MLHIKVDVVRWGVESMRETVAEVFIDNDGTGSRTVGNYDVYVEDPRGKAHPRDEREGWVGRIEGFPRDPGQSHAAALSSEALKLADDELRSRANATAIARALSLPEVA